MSRGRKPKDRVDAKLDREDLGSLVLTTVEKSGSDYATSGSGAEQERAVDPEHSKSSPGRCFGKSVDG